MTDDRLPELLTSAVLDELIAEHRRLWPRLGPWTTPAMRSRATWLRDEWIPHGVFEMSGSSRSCRLAHYDLDGNAPGELALASFRRFESSDFIGLRVGRHELCETGFRRESGGPHLAMVPRGALELMRELLRLQWLERVLS